MQVAPIFDINYNIDHTQYYWFQEGFSAQELEWFKNLVDLFHFEVASIVGSTDPSSSQEVRNSKIKWIHYDDLSAWVYDKLRDFAVEANNTLWNFDLRSIVDSIQYTEYHDNGGHYDWHVDIGPGISHRKISMVTQLSDPSEYEGGELQLWSGGQFRTIPKIKGCTVLFPSFLLHRVTPITSGVRKSMVLWAGGGNYK